MRITRDGIDEIKRRNDLCEVVMEHGITLKRRGRSYFGLCPFHEEETGSFAVSRESGLFHCFGCGAGGDVIGFIVRFHGVTFREALRRLAVRCGIDLETFCVTGDESSRRPARSTQNTIDAGFSRKLHEKAAERFTRLAAIGRRP
jgi:DNA primase catalytic core